MGVWNRQAKFTYNHWLAALVKGKCSSTKPTCLTTGVMCYPDTEQNRPYKPPPFLSYPTLFIRHPFNWKFLTPALFTIRLTFVHLLLVHTVLYIQDRFCPSPGPSFTTHKMVSTTSKNPYYGSYFQGNFLLPLPQIDKMLSNLLSGERPQAPPFLVCPHPFYRSTLFSDKMSTPTLFTNFQNLRLAPFRKHGLPTVVVSI